MELLSLVKTEFYFLKSFIYFNPKVNSPDNLTLLSVKKKNVEILELGSDLSDPMAAIDVVCFDWNAEAPLSHLKT